jgi:hypothetical protein
MTASLTNSPALGEMRKDSREKRKARLPILLAMQEIEADHTVGS